MLTSLSTRITAKEFASRIGKHEKTVQAWCRKARNKKATSRRRPPIVAVRIGRDWMIDVEATERAIALECGTAGERDAARHDLNQPLERAA